jgi:hypothetical protein
MTINFLCFVGIPRTGSSRAMQLLRGCPFVSVKGELFHTKKISKKELLAFDGIAAEAIESGKAMRAWRRKNARLTLETFLKLGADLPLAFKLFSGHLAKKAIVESLFGHTDVGYVVLRRRPIDSHISMLKAHVVGTHGGIETTMVKPSLDPDAFLKWAEETRDWYDWIGENLASTNAPHSELSYERHLRDTSDDEALTHILDAITKVGIPKSDRPTASTTRPRQDREEDFRKRVANWPEFVSALTPDHAEILEWALAEEAGA